MTVIQNKIAIIGGGPAGLSAAIYTSRAGLQPVVFAGSPPGGQLMLTSEVENFPGYQTILGSELVTTLRKQAGAFGAEIVDENITSVKFSKKHTVTTAKKIYSLRSVIIATGAQALWLGLDSETRLRGKGVSACATCDGFFFRDKKVAVVGGGDSAMEEAQTLTKFAKKVIIIHRRDSFRASKIMQDRVLNNPKTEVIWNASVTEILGEQKVEGVMLKIQNPKSTIQKLEVDGVFVAIGHKPDTAIFDGKIQLDEKGYILTSATKAIAIVKLLNGIKVADIEKQFNNVTGEQWNMSYQTMTSVPGIFAAGDCVDHTYRQAGTAAGMGIAAALDAEKWLEEVSQ